MNNWLEYFSLFPNQQSTTSHARQEISDATGAGCFDLSSVVPALNQLLPPAAFGFLETFNDRDHNHLIHYYTTTTATPLPPPSYNHHHHHTTPNDINHYNYMFTANPSTTTPATNDSNHGISVSINPYPITTLSYNTLSLSMMSGNTEPSGSGLPLVVAGGGGTGGDNERSSSNNENALIVASSGGGGGVLDASTPTVDAVVMTTSKKCVNTLGQRTSIFRGVTRHRWTGRYSANIWDSSCRREGSRSGRQVYLGHYDKEEKAARCYDLAAIKYWGTTTTTNFPISNYEKEVEEMKNMSREEYIASLRRKSSGFARGTSSIYRGVSRNRQQGRWQARIGRGAGNKNMHLGTFTTQEEAAEAYDMAAIKLRGLNAFTNFDINRYDVKAILESSTLRIGAVKRLRDVEDLNTPSIQLGNGGATTVVGHE